MWCWRRIRPGTVSRTRQTIASILPHNTHSPGPHQQLAHNAIQPAPHPIFCSVFWQMCLRLFGYVLVQMCARLRRLSLTGSTVRSGRAGRPAARRGPCREGVGQGRAGASCVCSRRCPLHALARKRFDVNAVYLHVCSVCMKT